MDLKNCLVEVKDGIAILTINRPEVRNALNAQCWDDINLFVDYISENEDVKIAIITGSGDKAFAAGADLKALRSRTMKEIINNASGQAVLRKLENCSKPSIAAVNGFAFGGGCELALACDIRIASENAVFGLPEVSVGVLPGAGGTQRLTRLIGLGRAKEIILTGRTVSGIDAVQIGLACKVVPLVKLMEEAKSLATTMMGKSPFCLGLAKKAIVASLSTDQDTGMLIEQFAFAMAMASEDKIEGIDAFFEKRKPEFKG